jgi:hypothetical protein
MLRLVPSDYDIYSTEPSHAQEAEPTPATDELNPEAAQNPASWPTDHRRIPPYRPINRAQDRSIRPGGENVPTIIFIATMLWGCHVVAV